MSITDELREFIEKRVWKGDYRRDNLLAIADRIDEEHERECKEQYACGAEHGIGASIEASMIQTYGYTELPKDADGEVIRVGDMMERGKARGHVIALMLSEYPKKWGGGLHWGVQLEGEQAPTALDLMFHHYHAPTVEEVLVGLIEKAVGYSEAHTLVAYSAVEEAAKRLRLAEEDNDG